MPRTRQRREQSSVCACRHEAEHHINGEAVAGGPDDGTRPCRKCPCLDFFPGYAPAAPPSKEEAPR